MTNRTMINEAKTRVNLVTILRDYDPIEWGDLLADAILAQARSEGVPAQLVEMTGNRISHRAHMAARDQ